MAGPPQGAQPLQRFHVRVRGKVSGPFSFEDLLQQVRHRKLTAVHEVSDDGRVWQNAGGVPGLFTELMTLPASPPAPTRVAADDVARASSAAPTARAAPAEVVPAQPRSWYYAIAGKREGPVGMESLRELMKRGVLTPDDLVFADGMNDWVALRTIPELRTPRRSRRDADDRDDPVRPSGKDFELGPLQIMSAILLLMMGCGNLLVSIALFALGDAASDHASVYALFGAHAMRDEAIGISAAATVIGLVLLAMGLAIIADGIGVFMAKRWAILGMQGVGVLNAILQGLCLMSPTGGKVGHAVFLMISLFLVVVGYTTPLESTIRRPRRSHDR